MDIKVSGRLGKVVYVQLEPNEDLYEAVLATAEEEGIRTGLVMDITGGLAKWRLSMPVEASDVASTPGVKSMEGLTEASGQGILGWAVDSYISEDSGVHIEAGRPFAHVHMSVTTAGETWLGHLIPGCEIRSVHPTSHFAIVIAEVEGVQLNFRMSEDSRPNYPDGVPIYELSPSQ